MANLGSRRRLESHHGSREQYWDMEKQLQRVNGTDGKTTGTVKCGIDIEVVDRRNWITVKVSTAMAVVVAGCILTEIPDLMSVDVSPQPELSPYSGDCFPYDGVNPVDYIL